MEQRALRTFIADISEAEYAAEVERHRHAFTWIKAPFTPADTIVALDIDGTLLNEEQCFSPRLIRNIDCLRDGGVHICLTTGRSVPATLPVVANLGLQSAWLATSNGSIIGHYTQKSGYSLVQRYTFDPRDAVQRILQVVPSALIGVEDGSLGYRVLAPFPPGELGETLEVQPLEQLLATPVSRVVVRAPQLSNQEFREIVANLELPGVEHAIGFRAWLDINPAGTSKATGLQYVCEKLGVDSAHTVAIGDGANDIPILRYAAYGVAMGVATPDVKAAADNTTLRVESDGSAAVLEALAQALDLLP